MKRADLNVGDEYLTARVHDWKQPGHHGIKRVRVLDDQPWATERHGSNTKKIKAITASGEHDVPERLQPVSSSQGVLVEELDQATGQPVSERNRYQVIQVGQFFATWAEGYAARQEVLNAERAKRDKRLAETAEANNRARAAASAIGGEAQTRGYFGLEATVTLSTQRAEEIARALYPGTDTRIRVVFESEAPDGKGLYWVGREGEDPLGQIVTDNGTATVLHDLLNRA